MQKTIYTITAILLMSLSVTAQENSSPEKKKSKWYTTRGGDAGLVSFSNVSRNGKMLNNVPRFTFFLNGGANFNYDFGKNAGFFTGINGKNLGVIYDDNDSVRYKRRVLAVGVPVGFKFGNLKKHNFFYLGGQADFALNYKEKRFVNGDKVSKSNEWFGNQTPGFMPSVFAGFQTNRKLGLKVQYFVNNFFNPDYTKDNIKPFAGMDANVFFLTLSYDFSVKEMFGVEKD
ncbi:MAG: hypothetical protein K2X48_12300 [Chitinophagaceae bacterium]|nr:hypothetical protein [Chitinophagaceae bacterium]